MRRRDFRPGIIQQPLREGKGTFPQTVCPWAGPAPPADKSQQRGHRRAYHGGGIVDSFPMRRAALPSLSEIVHPPLPPMPDRYRIDLCATCPMVDGPKCELGRADTISDAKTPLR